MISLLSERCVLQSCERDGQLVKGAQEIQQFHESTKSKGSFPELPGGVFPEKFLMTSTDVLALTLCTDVQLPGHNLYEK